MVQNSRQNIHVKKIRMILYNLTLKFSNGIQYDFKFDTQVLKFNKVDSK